MEVALQFDEVPRDVPSCDIVYFGERACTERFLFLAGSGLLRKGLAAAQAAKARAGLTAPVLVPESRYDEVADAVRAHVDVADLLATGDLGLLSDFGDALPVTFSGAIANPHTAGLLVRQGASRLRLLMPYLEILEDLGATPVGEVQLFGRLPLSLSPICLYRQVSGIRQCDPKCTGERIRLRRGGEGLLIQAKALLTEKPVNLTDRIDTYAPLIKTALVEASDLSGEELQDVVAALRERRPYRSDRRCFNGVDGGGCKDIFRGGVWRRSTPTRGSEPRGAG